VGAPRSVAHTDELRDSAKAWMVDAVAVEQRSIQQLDLRCASTIRIFYRNARLMPIPTATQKPTLKPVVRTTPNRKFQLTLPLRRLESAEKRHDSSATIRTSPVSQNAR